MVSSQSILSSAATELERVRCMPLPEADEFPQACRTLLYSIEGNNRCFDCGSHDTSWASISHGILLCMSCCGRHRSYGVNISVMRSILMDSWSHSQILSMLEGGNAQLKDFFDRHNMGNDSPSMVSRRYRTKAALFYRSNLKRHVDYVANSGVYEGREVARQKQQLKQQKRQQNSKQLETAQLEQDISHTAVTAPCC